MSRAVQQVSTPNGSIYDYDGRLWAPEAYNRQSQVPQWVREYYAQQFNEPAALPGTGGPSVEIPTMPRISVQEWLNALRGVNPSPFDVAVQNWQPGDLGPFDWSNINLPNEPIDWTNLLQSTTLNFNSQWDSNYQPSLFDLAQLFGNGAAPSDASRPGLFDLSSWLSNQFPGNANPWNNPAPNELSWRDILPPESFGPSSSSWLNAQGSANVGSPWDYSQNFANQFPGLDTSWITGGPSLHAAGSAGVGYDPIVASPWGSSDIANWANIDLGPSAIAQNSWTDPGTGVTHYYDANWNWLYSDSTAAEHQSSPGTVTDDPWSAWTPPPNESSPGEVTDNPFADPSWMPQEQSNRGPSEARPSNPYAANIVGYAPTGEPIYGSRALGPSASAWSTSPYGQGMLTTSPSSPNIGYYQGSPLYSTILGANLTTVGMNTVPSYGYSLGQGMVQLANGDTVQRGMFHQTDASPTGVGGESLEGGGPADWMDALPQNQVLAYVAARNAVRAGNNDQALSILSNAGITLGPGETLQQISQIPILSRQGPMGGHAMQGKGISHI